MDKLGVLHANKTSMCLDPYQIKPMRLYRLSPPKMFLLTVQRQVLLLYFWMIIFIFCVCICHTAMSVLQLCGHLLEKG